ncbi:hypothetical protein [Knoellia aerolata]|uniref:Uncharacterized protein n=1 Tax=Knoellia aerolata DSM 18566 TaxID=1385519 RepID=A0A0A0JRH1_9MICO|nr:hypothetical protein [Knoellia aerolata]KGN39798.1 hypothetical protein N801_18880 [Knoellia aerolata DSM 18566]
MATADLDELFSAAERALRELRRVSGNDLAKKKHFKEFIRRRNAFHDALTVLNDDLYREKDALILPELLDEGDDHFSNASGNVSLRVTVSARPDVLADGRIVRLVDDALHGPDDRFAVIEVRLLPVTE